MTNYQRVQITKVAPKLRRGLQSKSSVLIKYNDIKFLRAEPATEERVYAIRSPLTHNWIEFRVTELFILTQMDNPNYPAHIKAVLNYYEETVKLLEHARDIGPMNRDLQALDREEAQIFGLKSPDLPYTPKHTRFKLDI